MRLEKILEPSIMKVGIFLLIAVLAYTTEFEVLWWPGALVPVARNFIVIFYWYAMASLFIVLIERVVRGS